MTRTYALKRLLEHGELTLSQIRAITLWKPRQVRKTVEHLVEKGVVERTPAWPRFNYRLVEQS